MVISANLQPSPRFACLVECLNAATGLFAVGMVGGGGGGLFAIAMAVCHCSSPCHAMLFAMHPRVVHGCLVLL